MARRALERFLSPLVGAAHVTEGLTEADRAAVDHGGRDGSERTAHGVGHRLVYKTQSRGDIAHPNADGCESYQRSCHQLAVSEQPPDAQRFAILLAGSIHVALELEGHDPSELGQPPDVRTEVDPLEKPFRPLEPPDGDGHPLP